MNDEELFLNYTKLPLPLKEDEIYELIKMTQQGDEKAKEILVEHNIRLVVYEVNKRFHSVEYDKQELISIGIVGLMKAILTFDEKRKLQFSTYAITCIDNEILMFLRKFKKINNIESIDEPIFFDKDGNGVTVEDILSDDTDIVNECINKENHQILQKIINNLPPKEKELIILYFGLYDNKEHKQKDLADMFNINQATISRTIKKILQKIKTQLEETGIIERKNKKQKEKIKMPKKIKTIYEYFNTYTKDEIDNAIAKLNEEEKELIIIRYGNDLNNPTQEPLSKDNYNKFYHKLIPKLKKLLANPNQEITRKKTTRKKKNINDSSKEKTTTTNSDITTTNTETTIQADDYLKILELLKDPSFKEIMNKYNIKEIVIISLKLGYINGKYFSTKDISDFLEIEEQEVIDTTKKFLIEYKEKLNQIIDNIIQITEDKKDIITKKLNK